MTSMNWKIAKCISLVLLKIKNYVNESPEVSLGGEGGEEEAVGEDGGGQGEQAEKQLYWSFLSHVDDMAEL